MDVLPLNALWCQKFPQGCSIGLARILPVFLDGTPPAAEPFLISITVLRNDRCDPIRVSNCEPPSHRRTVIEYEKGITVQPNYVRERINGVSKVTSTDCRIQPLIQWA